MPPLADAMLRFSLLSMLLPLFADYAFAAISCHFTPLPCHIFDFARCADTTLLLP